MIAMRKCSRLARSGVTGLLAATVLLAFHGAALATIKIVAIGTSNTYGRYVARGEDYPAKLEAVLKSRGHDVQVINAGRNGDTIAGGLARLDFAVPPDAHIAIVEFGVNDRRDGVAPGIIQASLGQIVDRLRARNVEVLVANYVDVPGGAKAHGALFVSFDVSQFPASMRMASDPLRHLTPAGYDVIVARMLPAVEALIARVQKRER